jgi:hypothetical protein
MDAGLFNPISVVKIIFAETPNTTFQPNRNSSTSPSIKSPYPQLEGMGKIVCLNALTSTFPLLTQILTK